MLGIMVQLDGSPHDWFEGRAKKCTLMVFIDDATSRILWLEFVSNESVISFLQAIKTICKNMIFLDRFTLITDLFFTSILTMLKILKSNI